MLGQRGIRLGQHQRPQLRVAGRIKLRRAARARSLGQRLALTVPGQPTVDRAQIDAKALRRFTRWQPVVKGTPGDWGLGVRVIGVASPDTLLIS